MKQAINKLQVQQNVTVSVNIFYITDFHVSAAELNPAVLPLDWLLGTWQSDEPGEGSFPSIAPFRYTETLHFSHVGQPVVNFM